MWWGRDVESEVDVLPLHADQQAAAQEEADRALPPQREVGDECADAEVMASRGGQ
jgi:hypothetical protein